MMLHLCSKEMVEAHSMVVVAPVVVLLSTAVQAQVQALRFLMQTVRRRILLYCWEQLVDVATAAVLL